MQYRFNRYIVECKGFSIVTDPVPFADLIDTLWNVKPPQASRKKSIITDLIDTLWNVKQILNDICVDQSSGFNRYIVECKGFGSGS